MLAVAANILTYEIFMIQLDIGKAVRVTDEEFCNVTEWMESFE